MTAFVITSGVRSLQGTIGPPLDDEAQSTANFDVRSSNLFGRHVGKESAFFALTVRASRAFAVSRGVRVAGLVAVLNVTNRVNDLTRRNNFGARAYPTNPLPTFNQITAMGDPPSVQVGLRLAF